MDKKSSPHLFIVDRGKKAQRFDGRWWILSLQLVHDCNVQLAAYRNAVQCIGTNQDGAQLRKDLDASGRACVRSCEAAKNCVLPQLRHEGYFVLFSFPFYIVVSNLCLYICVYSVLRFSILELLQPELRNFTFIICFIDWRLCDTVRSLTSKEGKHFKVFKYLRAFYTSLILVLRRSSQETNIS